eukprot:2169949-Pyramimonas_sp.AAC.1
MAKDPTICSCECRRCQYRLRWVFCWGHEARGKRAGMGRSTAGLPIRGHEACEECTKMGRRRHADCATGTLGGLPYWGHDT